MRNSWFDRWAERSQRRSAERSRGGGDIREVFGAHGNFVLRLEPVGTPSAFGHLFDYVVVTAAVLRLATRERRWVIQVRHRKDDPDGPVLHEEVFASRDEARPRLDDLEKLYRRGRPPAA